MNTVPLEVVCKQGGFIPTGEPTSVPNFLSKLSILGSENGKIYAQKKKDKKQAKKKEAIEKNYLSADEITIRLKDIVKSKIIDHKSDIILRPTLKDAHIYCKVRYLSGALTGTLIEYYIQFKYHMTKNNAGDCCGDLSVQSSSGDTLFDNKINFEIKVSNGGKNNKCFNYVQIRMNHQVDEYLLTAYYISEQNLNTNGELFIFRLKKEQIKTIIKKYGSYAHGTIKKLGKITEEELNNITNDKEYAFRPTYKDALWKELLKFRVEEICV